jgi:tetratricopeptide (TPR) repeat protein
MSDTRPEQDRNEATVVPVRRPRPVGETTAEPAKPFRVGRALLAVSSVLLLAVLVFVLVYLPNRVEQARLIEAVQQDAVPVETVPAPATPRLTAEEREALRAEAEDLRFSLLEQQEELNARSAESWGASTWEAYQAQARRGDDALLADDLPRAVEQYETALATGEQLFASSRTIMANAQTAGEAAIAAGNPELAMTQFSIVLAVEPENRNALRGQQRAAALPDLLDAMRRGDQSRRQGEFEAAAAAYREALAIDPNWTAAGDALDAVTGTLADNRFESLVADGYVALDEGRFDSAIESFTAAIAMRPGSDAAGDGLAEAEQRRLLNSIALAEVRGRAFERRELWNDAIARYREALALDPTLSFAIEGLARAQYRADLVAKLDALIDSPRLLLGDEVLAEAANVLAEAQSVDDPGPSHSSKTEQLAALIDAASTPIGVTLVSDNMTEVTVYRVDELGTFTSLQLKLKPGQYTAIGARRGYRDVRKQFTVLPGRDNGPVEVICVEPI